MKSIRIAILGATSHIAKGLIAAWGARADRELYLYARSPERARQFTDLVGVCARAVLSLDEFGRTRYDVIVNCIGIGDPGKLGNDVASIFNVTETWDNRVLHYLAANADTLYINLSSGAAYGSDFHQPADDAARAMFALNSLVAGDFYGIAKLNAEAKHRAFSGLNIVDLRIFSYFSRYMDIGTKFLLSEVITCVRQRRELVTTPVDIVRDYVHPSDFVELLERCMAKEKINGAFDVFSREPARKFEILDYFSDKYGLKYRLVEEADVVTVTGAKDNYYSSSRKALTIGYAPRFSSLDCVSGEAAVLLESAD